jgi:DNA integrity scanning protein DisA with diadenylate cyclase activity
MIDYPQDTKQNQMILARAFHRLETLNEVRPVLDFLRSELRKLDMENRTELDEIRFRHNQGASQALSDLISMVSMARDKFVLFKNKEEPG